MVAIFQKSAAVINDESEASRIHNKGCYGEPQSGGSLKLNLLETLYLFESERLSVADQEGQVMDFGQLLTYASRRISNFEVRYIAYCDMRKRGLIVNLAEGKPEGIDFLLYGRGETPKNSSPRAFVLTISERSLFDLDDLFSICEGAEGTGKDVILSVVDEEGDITYYRIKIAQPSARMRESFDAVFQGIALVDRVVVSDAEAADNIRKTGFYGNAMGPGLQISLLEAVHLMMKKALKVRSAKTGKNATLGSVTEAAARIDPEFEQKLAVYQDLKDRGFAVKTGFKYGSHFRAYDSDPEKAHARFLVHAVTRGFMSSWPEISRAVRVAHGVRKEILFARVGKSGVQYLELSRHLP